MPAQIFRRFGDVVRRANGIAAAECSRKMIAGDALNMSVGERDIARPVFAGEAVGGDARRVAISDSAVCQAQLR